MSVNTTVAGLPELTSLNDTDVFYVIRPSDTTKDYKTTVTTIKTKINSENSVEVSATGSIDVSKDIILLNVGLSAINLILPDGTANKEILIVGKSLSSNAVITVTNFISNNTITFTLTGQTIKLKFISGKWYILSNNGTTIA